MRTGLAASTVTPGRTAPGFQISTVRPRMPSEAIPTTSPTAIARLATRVYQVLTATRLGNAGRNTINGPSQFSRNASAGRIFRPSADRFSWDIRLDASNALEIVRSYDLVLDGTDNFPTRYLVSDACEILRVPVVWGSIFRFDGSRSPTVSSE